MLFDIHFKFFLVRYAVFVVVVDAARCTSFAIGLTTELCRAFFFGLVGHCLRAGNIQFTKY